MYEFDGRIEYPSERRTKPILYVVTGQTPNSTEYSCNLTAGMYGLTVTDQSGCVAVSTRQINSVNGMSLNSSIINTSCGLNNGQLDVSVIGGMAPYTYAMSGPGVSPPYQD
ncbi:MAG: SprB repeat-containing protein [Saprospiraceae bacterium]|nr:SprB repeat-containing protein [Saprospiraceae bacterium]